MRSYIVLQTIALIHNAIRFKRRLELGSEGDSRPRAAPTAGEAGMLRHSRVRILRYGIAL